MSLRTMCKGWQALVHAASNIALPLATAATCEDEWASPSVYTALNSRS